jgi:hypothetical protein
VSTQLIGSAVKCHSTGRARGRPGKVRRTGAGPGPLRAASPAGAWTTARSTPRRDDQVHLLGRRTLRRFHPRVLIRPVATLDQDPDHRGPTSVTVRYPCPDHAANPARQRRPSPQHTPRATSRQSERRKEQARAGAASAPATGCASAGPRRLKRRAEVGASKKMAARNSRAAAHHPAPLSPTISEAELHALHRAWASSPSTSTPRPGDHRPSTAPEHRRHRSRPHPALPHRPAHRGRHCLHRGTGDQALEPSITLALTEALRKPLRAQKIVCLTIGFPFGHLCCHARRPAPHRRVPRPAAGCPPAAVAHQMTSDSQRPPVQADP